ncbi:hypothetical protein BD414DRAFT_492097 [Trametes punicea]|nr:hypothetical protein BD414DRAFT_492097 [Trametes punicea]
MKKPTACAWLRDHRAPYRSVRATDVVLYVSLQVLYSSSAPHLAIPMARLPAAFTDFNWRFSLQQSYDSRMSSPCFACFFGHVTSRSRTVLTCAADRVPMSPAASATRILTVEAPLPLYTRLQGILESVLPLHCSSRYRPTRNGLRRVRPGPLSDRIFAIRSLGENIRLAPRSALPGWAMPHSPRSI